MRRTGSTLATERLERLRDGTSDVVFSPLELLEKLVAVVPKPRANMVRYHGVLGPAAKWRPEVIRLIELSNPKVNPTTPAKHKLQRPQP